MLILFKLIPLLCLTDQSESKRYPQQSNAYLWNNLSIFSAKWAKDYSARIKPIVEDLFKNSDNVSQNCYESIMSTIDGIARFEDWAIEMINSWARFPPVGLFDGTLTDFGSYDQCLGVDDNPSIGSTQYCSIILDPPLPRPMPKQHNVFHQIPNLLSSDVYQNSSNALIKIANESSTFYWLSIRTAVCLPNKCTETDIKSLAKTGINFTIIQQL